MSQVIVDPSELRRFSAFLGELIVDLRTAEQSCSRKFSELKTVWRDDKLKEFEPKYERTVSELDRFSRACERYAAYLDSKASRVEKYLQG
jgi:uncharacterized protein YukE